jgi:transposase
MAVPYSYDLRKKVIQALDKGMKKTKVSRVFNVSRNTIDLWLKRRKVTGEFKAIEGDQKGSRHKILNWEAFREFAEANGSLTQAEMAQAWEGEVSRHTIRRGLKKINFTRKKRHTVIEKEPRPLLALKARRVSAR